MKLMVGTWYIKSTICKINYMVHFALPEAFDRVILYGNVDFSTREAMNISAIVVTHFNKLTLYPSKENLRCLLGKLVLISSWIDGKIHCTS